MTEITISASRTYSVRIGTNLLEQCGEAVRSISEKAQKAAIITDDIVYELYGRRVEESLRRVGFQTFSFVFPHGEEQKNLDTYAAAQNFLAEHRVSRGDIIIALGGGVSGDLAGFTAATYMRGIPYVQIPTTVLAAVDSSVGGKTAVNLNRGKNLCGCFYQPELVLCDCSTFSTLPPEVFRDGCAEVIKYGVLGGGEFFAGLEQTPAEEQIEGMVAHCVSMKGDLVCKDEFDRGYRQLLNLGHTVGHAIEVCSDFQISHGKAVAAGMAIMARSARKQGICDPEVPERIVALLKKYSLPCETAFSAEELYQAACADKKITGGTVCIVVPEAIGKCVLKTIKTEELFDWISMGLCV